MFLPARWILNPHLQTIWGAVARRPRQLLTVRERWELSDGDLVDVERLPAPNASAPLLVVCHGLEGSSQANYVRGVLDQASRANMGAVALNFRGCSGEQNRMARFYHSGETGDLAQVIDRLIGEQRDLALIGFSLGGNVVAKYLGERGDSVPTRVRAAAVVSVPFDLALCATTIDGPGLPALLYRERFLRRLRRKVRAKTPRFPEIFGALRTEDLRSFRAFDEEVTARLHGFAGAEDYWTKSSAGPLLDRVRRPLLIIHAEDDPLVPVASLPLDRIRGNPNIELDVVARGGHVGFVSGLPWRAEYWAERRVVEFLAEKIASLSGRASG